MTSQAFPIFGAEPKITHNLAKVKHIVDNKFLIVFMQNKEDIFVAQIMTYNGYNLEPTFSELSVIYRNNNEPEPESIFVHVLGPTRVAIFYSIRNYIKAQYLHIEENTISMTEPEIILRDMDLGHMLFTGDTLVMRSLRPEMARVVTKDVDGGCMTFHITMDGVGFSVGLSERLHDRHDFSFDYPDDYQLKPIPGTDNFYEVRHYFSGFRTRIIDKNGSDVISEDVHTSLSEKWSDNRYSARLYTPVSMTKGYFTFTGRNFTELYEVNDFIEGEKTIVSSVGMSSGVRDLLLMDQNHLLMVSHDNEMMFLRNNFGRWSLTEYTNRQNGVALNFGEAPVDELFHERYFRYDDRTVFFWYVSGENLDRNPNARLAYKLIYQNR